MGATQSKRSSEKGAEKWVSAIDIMQCAKGTEATKDCRQMLKKLGAGVNGTLDEPVWQKFLTNFKGWLEDHNKYDQATMWYDVAQGMTLTAHKAKDTDKGTMYEI